MEDRKIKVYGKRPGGRLYSTWVMNTLENLQKLVGGYIEAVTLAEDCAVICDEEGRLKGLEPNCRVGGVDFVGDIFFVGVDGEEFTDMPVEFDKFKKMFRRLEGE